MANPPPAPSLRTPKPKTKKIAATLTPVEDLKRIDVSVKVPLTENIIFIGSEMHYDSFWWKMMFIAAAYPMAAQMRKSNRLVVAYVPEGYTHLEKLAIETLGKTCQNQYSDLEVEFKPLNSSADLVALFNRQREEYKLLDVYFSSHGLNNVIHLSFDGDLSVYFTESELMKISATAFCPNGRLTSYACRTGTSSVLEKFKNDEAAFPEKSLAQKIANYFSIQVHAFMRRTDYSEVIREEAKSSEIIQSIRQERENWGDLSVLTLSDEHEALPHPGLANKYGKFYGFGGPKGEGTDNFSLWRKLGGRVLPAAADSPKGLSTSMRVFMPLPVKQSEASQ